MVSLPSNPTTNSETKNPSFYEFFGTSSSLCFCLKQTDCIYLWKFRICRFGIGCWIRWARYNIAKFIPKNTSHNKHMRREVSMGQFITMHARQKCLNSLLFIFLNGAKPKPLNGWGWPRQFSGFYGVRSLIIIIRKPLPDL